MSTAQAVLRVYLALIWRRPAVLVAGFVGVIGMQVAALITPVFLRHLFNLLAAGPSAHAREEVLWALMFVAGGWLAYWAANRLEHFANLFIITRGMSDAISEAFKHLIGHSYNFFISSFAGALTHKVNRFAKAYQIIFEAAVLTFVPTLLFLAGSIIVLSLYNLVLGLILGAWVVVFIAFQLGMSNLRQPYRRLRAEADSKVTATSADAISNQVTITLFSASKFEVSAFNNVVEAWRKAGVRAWLTDAYVWTVTDFLMVLIQVVLLAGAIHFWSQGMLTVGDFVLIQTYLLVIFGKLISIQNDLKRVYDAFADAGEMLDILTKPHDVRDKRGAKKLKTDVGEIVFDDVTFGFHDDNILHQFNLKIGGGEKVALVGPSGAGKSTVTKLLLRLYEIKKGQILIDAQNIAEVTQDSLREDIAFVPQEPILFHRTLMENIRYGRRDATDEEVIEAAKKAHCHEFIGKLPLKYETYVGERGIKLSGGERQRVAIARAILKDAPILVLDEATSSLDSESEALIQDALEVLMQGKTVVVIAHRLSTIMKMDRIVVMEQGKVVAQGTHLELVRERGLYQKLWSIQAGGFLGDGQPVIETKEAHLEELEQDLEDEKTP